MGRKKMTVVERIDEQRLKECLIVLWEQYPALYNKNHPDFKKPAVIRSIYKKMAAEAKCTAVDVQVKLKSLRDCYVREKRFRELEAMSGAGSSKRVPFLYYEQRYFLHAHIRVRCSVSSVQSDSDDDKEDDREDSQEESSQVVETENEDEVTAQESQDLAMEHLLNVSGLDSSIDLNDSAGREAWAELQATENIDSSLCSNRSAGISKLRKSPRIASISTPKGQSVSVATITPVKKGKNLRMKILSAEDPKADSASKSSDMSSQDKGKRKIGDCEQEGGTSTFGNIAGNSKKLKKTTGAKSATLPLISPAREKSGIHEKRSKAKHEAELTVQLGRAVRALEKSVSSPPPQPQASTPEQLLGQAVALALSGIKNKRKKVELMSEFRGVIGKCELAQCDDED